MNGGGPSVGEPTRSAPAYQATAPLVRGRAERRRADEIGAGVPGDRSARPRVVGAEPHDQIVRMLEVLERRRAERLAGLEDLRRADPVQRERLERQHADRMKRPPRERMHGVSHQPVLRFPRLKVAELPLLIVEAEEDRRVGRPVPSGRRGSGVLHARHVRHRLCARDGSQREEANKHPGGLKGPRRFTG